MYHKMKRLLSLKSFLSETYVLIESFFTEHILIISILYTCTT